MHNTSGDGRNGNAISTSEPYVCALAGLGTVAAVVSLLILGVVEGFAAFATTVLVVGLVALWLLVWVASRRSGSGARADCASESCYTIFTPGRVMSHDDTRHTRLGRAATAVV